MSSDGDSWVSMNSFHRLQRRQLTGKLPKSFWDYHLRALPVDERVTDLVIADDIICVFCNTHLIPFGREGKISPLKDEYGKPLKLNCSMVIQIAYYNSNNNSLIMVGYHESLPYLKILSIEIASIKAGRINEYREIYAEEADRNDWDFDIPNCRGIIYNVDQSVLKIFDLKEYNQISTIAVEREINFNIQSRGNIYVLKNFHRSPYNVSRITFKIYSKQDGEQCQEAIVYVDPQIHLRFATLCGNDLICLQHFGKRMELIDISDSDEDPEVIQTNFEAMVKPYYLDKLDRFLCYTTTGRLHVCNKQGDILLTFHDHPMSIRVLNEIDSYRGTYITSGQDLIISVCDPFESHYCSINISSIITGECLTKITIECGSQIREAALSSQIVSIAYDERTREIFTVNEKGICCVWCKNFPSDHRRLPGITTAEDIEE